MESGQRDEFIGLWRRYFPGAELPICFFYADETDAEVVKKGSGWRCFVADLGPVRLGEPRAFGIDSHSCEGSKRYTGFSQQLPEGIEHMLSCGAEGIEGERYKKTPELVLRSELGFKSFVAPRRYLVCKRWDTLAPGERPAVVSFVASADVISGLLVLANFDRPDNEGVASPFVSGCCSILCLPYNERDISPRAFLGLFDPSARPFVGGDELSFSVCYGRFVEMVENIPESFVVAPAWSKLLRRMGEEG